jgi:hypothetical protein
MKSIMDKTKPIQKIKAVSLSPDHIEDLRKSGISDGSIRAAGLYTVPPDEIKRKLGYDPPLIKSLLGIPYPGCNGFERFKIFPITPGRPKYLQKKDSRNHLYIPPKVRPVLQDRSTKLIFTEGEKKALKASQEGIFCIGLSGLWNWKNRGESGLISDFNQIELKNRRVEICPDSDWLDPNKNGYPKNLQQAVFALAGKLMERGAVVSIRELPKGPKGKKVGLDDYLLNHSVTEFKALPERTIEKQLLIEMKPNRSRIDPPWPSPLAQEAFHGLAGRFVQTIEPHTEADPVALLAQFLAAFGNVIGRGSWFEVESTRHHLNLFINLVGDTGKGRKGTSLGQAKNILQTIDPAWAKNFKGGLSSGEGLIWAVRDPIYRKEQNKKTKEIEEVLVDEGVEDKRLLVIEEELASILKVMEREGNTLSAIIRKCWDDGNLASLTKNNPAIASDAHISIIGHITIDELRRRLTRTEAGNGFANRFCFFCVKRSKVLPEGGNAQQIEWKPFLDRLNGAVKFGLNAGLLRKNEEAKELWARVYPSLSDGKPGLFGAVTSRSEAQTMRLACLYAVLDQSNLIKLEHLLAALALWDNAEASARHIFGDATGDRVADQILQALRGCPGGLTRTDISGLFGRNKNADRIDQALVFLVSRGLVKKTKEKTQGRPVELWVAV